MRLVLKTHSRRDIDNPNPICTTASQISLAWTATLLPISRLEGCRKSLKLRPHGPHTRAGWTHHPFRREDLDFTVKPSPGMGILDEAAYAQLTAGVSGSC